MSARAQGHYRVKSWRTLWRERCRCGSGWPCTLAGLWPTRIADGDRVLWPTQPGWNAPTVWLDTPNVVRPYVPGYNSGGWWRA